MIRRDSTAPPTNVATTSRESLLIENLSFIIGCNSCCDFRSICQFIFRTSKLNLELMQQEQRNRVKVAEPASSTASGRIVSSRRLDLASNVATRTAAIDEQRTKHKLDLRTFYTNHHSVNVKAASDGPRSRIKLKPNQSFNPNRRS